MKYKILGEKPPEEREPKKVLIKDGLFWRCEKCGILYGKGETILTLDDWMLCPVHNKETIYSADLDYWKERYNLTKN